VKVFEGERRAAEKEKKDSRKCYPTQASRLTQFSRFQNKLNTISELEKHLHKIDNKLQTLSLQDARMCDIHKKCKERLTNTISKLEEHLRKINNKLQNFSSQTKISGQHTAEQRRIQKKEQSQTVPNHLRPGL
jgi:hypothetical protein